MSILSRFRRRETQAAWLAEEEAELEMWRSWAREQVRS